MNRLVDRETGETLFNRLVIADTFWRRALGLMGRKAFAADEAILIRPCNSVHTCMMRFEIDVAFCDEDGKVLKVIESLRPWRFVIGPKGSRFVVEFASGAAMVIAGQQLKTER